VSGAGASGDDTRHASYAQRLTTLSQRGIRRYIDVQAPYRWHLRRLDLGRTLDVGCGIGRNLVALPEGSVGVDHNVACVSACREAGLEAYDGDEFAAAADDLGRFESLLFAHVLEHMPRPEAVELVRAYLPVLGAGGRVVVITPQARGFRSDPTHVDFVDFAAVRELAAALGLATVRQYSFPFPAAFGGLFTYNEFVSLLVAG
jgi:2-polyprenyl-3-methyl-5-hydroxy-6-metoxy-1,4-benzoquinol methylase